MCKTTFTGPANSTCWGCIAYICTAAAFDALFNVFADTALLPADLFIKPRHDKYLCSINQPALPTNASNASVTLNANVVDGIDSVGVLLQLNDTVRTWPDKKLIDVTTATNIVANLQIAIDELKKGNKESTIKVLRLVRHTMEVKADKSGANHLIVDSAVFDLKYVAHELGSTAHEDNVQE